MFWPQYAKWLWQARWALDAHGISYKSTQYTPIFGEKRLQQRTGKHGKVTVPVLFTAEGAALAHRQKELHDSALTDQKWSTCGHA